MSGCFNSCKFIICFTIWYTSLSWFFFYRFVLVILKDVLFIWNLEYSCLKEKSLCFSLHQFSSVQFSRSVMSNSFVTPWTTARQASLSILPCLSTPGVYPNSCHRVGDAIQPSHPLSSPSPPATNPSQHQGLFQCINSSHEVAKVLEFQLQHQSFQWTPRTDLL